MHTTQKSLAKKMHWYLENQKAKNYLISLFR